MTSTKRNMTDRFSEFAMRLGGEIHLQSLRDTFAILMPFFVLAGLGTLVTSVFFPWFLSGVALEKVQIFGGLVNNATLNICGLLVAPITAFTLARHRSFVNPIGASAVAISALFTFMPLINKVTSISGKSVVSVAGIVQFKNIGTQSMFAGVIVGLLVTEIFIKLANNKKFQINLGENVPPQVGKSFESMIPTIITISICALLSASLIIFLKMDFITIISTMIQEPLRKINTSLPGYLFIFALGNILFTFGIHSAVVFGTILEPLLIANINDNMIAFSNGKVPPHILTKPFVTVFAQMGGSGCTISLLIAILIFSKYEVSKKVGLLSVAPGIFNINEPLIYGFPIVFNIPMMIPFVSIPLIFSIIGYVLTAIGWVSKTVVFVPWMTPPLISGYLATGGDWRAVVIQIILIIIGVLIYLPFLRISDNISRKESQLERESK